MKWLAAGSAADKVEHWFDQLSAHFPDKPVAGFAEDRRRIAATFFDEASRHAREMSSIHGAMAAVKAEHPDWTFPEVVQEVAERMAAEDRARRTPPLEF